MATSVTVPAPSRKPAGSVSANARSIRRRRARHRHLERAHASLRQGVDHGAELTRIFQADHGDDAERFNPGRHRGARLGSWSHGVTIASEQNAEPELRPRRLNEIDALISAD